MMTCMEQSFHHPHRNPFGKLTPWCRNTKGRGRSFILHWLVLEMKKGDYGKEIVSEK